MYKFMGCLSSPPMLLKRSDACMQAVQRVQQALGPWRVVAECAALSFAMVAALFLLHVALWHMAVSEQPVGFVNPVGSAPCTASPAGEQFLGPCLASPSGQQLGYVDPVERTPCTVGPAGERLLGPCLVSPSGQRLAPASPADARAFDGFAFGPHGEQQAPGAAVGAAGPLGASGSAFGPCMDRPGHGARNLPFEPTPRGALAFQPCLDLPQSGALAYEPCLDLPQGRGASPARGAVPPLTAPRAVPCMDLSPGAYAAHARAERKGLGASGPSTAGRWGAPLVSVNGPPGPSAPSPARFAALPPRAHPLPSSRRGGAASTNISAPVLPPVAYALSGAAGACAAARDGAKSTALQALAIARAAACRHANGALPAAACGHAAAQGRRQAGAGAASGALRPSAVRLGSMRRPCGAPSAVATASAAFLDDFDAALAQNRCSAVRTERARCSLHVAWCRVKLVSSCAAGPCPVEHSGASQRETPMPAAVCGCAGHWQQNWRTTCCPCWLKRSMRAARAACPHSATPLRGVASNTFY